MVVCSVCKSHFQNVNILITHLKVIHGCDKSSFYECHENTCRQTFQNISAFKKHLTVVHADDKRPDQCSREVCTNLSITYSKPEVLPNSALQYSNNAVCQEKDIVNNKQEIISCLLQFILSLHNNNNFSRKDVVNIQTKVNELIILPMQNFLINYSNTCCKNDAEQIYNFITTYKELFTQVNSEHKLFKYLLNNDQYCKPKEFFINREISNIHKAGESILTEKVDKGIVMPLEFQFRKVFEKNDVLQDCTNFMDKLSSSSGNLSNFVQGKLWMEKKNLYKGKVLIPYFLYIDDLEINNPLGSHTQTITAIYYSFPTLPHNSKLNNVYLAALLKSKDVKNYGNDLTMHTLIETIISLEVQGVNLNINETNKKVHFILGLILGDNLGLNQLLEFSKSFSANYYCRFCAESKENLSKLSTENIFALRNEENYNHSVQSFDSSLTGILKNSLLNSIPSFHVTKNFAVDVMHDVFEGVAHYNLTHIINYCIKQGFFSLEDFNNLKQNFSYGETEIGNICKDVLPAHLKRKKFNTTAREMWTLVHHFTLIVGHLVPTNNKVWEFTCIFIKIIDYLLLPKFTEEELLELELLIKSHNELYVKLFEDPLKPKHHFLLHYPRVIRMSGPPKFYWCFRFEAKHRELKTYAKVITSRKNILTTLATKFQLKFAVNLMNKSIDSIIYNDSKQVDIEDPTLMTKFLNVSSNDVS